jgi:FtsZ-binding cell division protein ZapB
MNNGLSEITTQIALIIERQETNNRLSGETIRAIRDDLTNQTKELKESINVSTHDWQEAIKALGITTDTKIQKAVDLFDERSKNFVLNVEFGTIKYIVLTIGLGFIVQVLFKYMIHL